VALKVTRVPTLLLVRHGRTSANAGGVLAGWTPGVTLDETGTAQARALGERMAALPLAAAVSSPLERCLQTTRAILAGRDGASAPPLVQDPRLGEAHYGDWTGAELKKVAKDPLWRVVQAHPSAAVFPSRDGGEPGESLRAMQARAVDAIREGDARVAAEHGPDALWLACSHGDVIKAVVADALGLHLDLFQRLVVDPASVTVLRYTEVRPFLLRLNDTGGDLTGLRPPKRRRRSRRVSSDAVVGGGAGAP